LLTCDLDDLKEGYDLITRDYSLHALDRLSMI